MSGLPLTITHLEVQSNNLTSIDAIAVLASLQYLDVSGNQLTSLQGIQSSAPIRTVKAAGNYLSSLGSLRQINKNTLRTLLLDNNCVAEVTELRILTEFGNLSMLSLYDNPFTEAYPAYHGAISAKVPSLTMLDGVQIKAATQNQVHNAINRERPTQRTAPTQQRPATTQGKSCIRKSAPRSSSAAPPGRVGGGNSFLDSKITERGIHSDSQHLTQQPYDEGKIRELLQTAKQLPRPFQHQPTNQTTPVDNNQNEIEEESVPLRNSNLTANTLDNPLSLSNERKLQIQVTELQRLLENSQVRVFSLERELGRKNEELSITKKVIQEQRNELTANKTSINQTDEKYTQLKEKADKLTREFKYNRQTITNLRGQLKENSTKDVSGISSHRSTSNTAERRFHVGGNTSSFNSMLQGTSGRVRRPSQDSKRPVRSLSHNPPQNRGRDQVLLNPVIQKLKEPEISDRSRSTPPVSHASPARSSTSPSHHKVLSHVSPPKTNMRQPNY